MGGVPPLAGGSCLWMGEASLQQGGLEGRGAGDISVQLPYVLHYHMVLRPKGTSHNKVPPKGDLGLDKCKAPLPLAPSCFESNIRTLPVDTM